MLTHSTACRAGLYIWSELPSGQSKNRNHHFQESHFSKAENKLRVPGKPGTFLGQMNSRLSSYRPFYRHRKVLETTAPSSTIALQGTQ